MFLAIDVGGTKTLIATFTQNGKISKSIKLKTPKDYSKFIGAVTAALARFDNIRFNYACVAIPGVVDRKNGIGKVFGNLNWKNVSIKKDLKKIIKCPIIIENDAKLAGLSEARNVIHEYKKTLYLTISTGISDGIIVNGIIDPNFADSEAGHMMVQFNDEMHKWEDIASGRAIKQRYGKLAKDITDRKTWREICYRLAIGINALIATTPPDVIIIGGSVGTYFNRFKAPLLSELKKLSTPLTPVPPILKAKNPEEAVIYGCYEMSKDEYEKLG